MKKIISIIVLLLIISGCNKKQPIFEKSNIIVKESTQELLPTTTLKYNYQTTKPFELIDENAYYNEGNQEKGASIEVSFYQVGYFSKNSEELFKEEIEKVFTKNKVDLKNKVVVTKKTLRDAPYYEATYSYDFAQAHNNVKRYYVALKSGIVSITFTNVNEYEMNDEIITQILNSIY
ncbi:MAG: lipoprotein [Bacilli bacterium]